MEGLFGVGLWYGVGGGHFALLLVQSSEENDDHCHEARILRILTKNKNASNGDTMDTF
jgi:signal recognition particle receptor subunit beta